MRRGLGVAIVITLVFWSLSAQADDEDWVPDTHRSGAGVELYPWSSDFGLHTPFIGFANIGVGDTFFVDVFLPVALGLDGPQPDPTRAGMGNPGAAFRYATRTGIVRWWVGGGLALPLNAVDDFDWRLETAFAAASMGAYQSYLWAPEYFPIFATGGADIRVAEFVSIQVSGEPIVLIDVDEDNPFRDAAELVLQTRIGAEFRHPETGLGGGLHFKLVFIPTANTNLSGSSGNFQSSVEPHFAYTTDSFFARFGLLFAIDRPLGPAFDNGGVFSQHATVGGSW